MFAVFRQECINARSPQNLIIDKACYTPGIYAEGYIVFVFLFVHTYVRSFVRWYFRPVRGITKFYVQATRVEYISSTTHQKAFIFDWARMLDRKRVRLACKRHRVQSPRPAHSFVETWS